MTLHAAEGAHAEDRELVERFLATREEAAFRALYRAHTPYLWSLSVRLCRDSGMAVEAEEVVQEAWIRGIRLLPRFVWGSALRTWLAGILINCWREQCRSGKFRQTGEVENVVSDTAVETCADAIDLERGLASLSDEHRSVLLLYDHEGYNHEEIGELLGIPAGTSKSRLFKARRVLRQHFGVRNQEER